jgi:hypothetical protein
MDMSDTFRDRIRSTGKPPYCNKHDTHHWLEPGCLVGETSDPDSSAMLQG